MSQSAELRLLVERYRDRAASLPAAEFCRRVLGEGVPRFYAAVLLRDLYGFNLMECKMLIGECERENDPT